MGEKKENVESNAMSASYSNVVRKGGQLRLRIKNKSSKKHKMISLKKAIDKKAKNKRIKIKTEQGVKKKKKKKKRTLKYKSAEELLDERRKKKRDKYAWC